MTTDGTTAEGIIDLRETASGTLDFPEPVPGEATEQDIWDYWGAAPNRSPVKTVATWLGLSNADVASAIYHDRTWTDLEEPDLLTDRQHAVVRTLWDQLAGVPADDHSQVDSPAIIHLIAAAACMSTEDVAEIILPEPISPLDVGPGFWMAENHGCRLTDILIWPIWNELIGQRLRHLDDEVPERSPVHWVASELALAISPGLEQQAEPMKTIRRRVAEVVLPEPVFGVWADHDEPRPVDPKTGEVLPLRILRPGTLGDFMETERRTAHRMSKGRPCFRCRRATRDVTG
jgi:hypothetical protein